MAWVRPAAAAATVRRAQGTTLLALAWAGWHAPLFLIVQSYRAMTPAMVAGGFGFGLLCGSFVLAQVCARARGSVPAVAAWHLFYNLATATEVGGLVPILVSAVVMTWGTLLIICCAIRRDRAERLRVPPPPGT